MADPRYIKSELKTRKIISEEEKPIRWSYMKILREFSNLKKMSKCNPYVEVYKIRENMWAIYSESLDGAGDPWMYLIEGPTKAMLIDTGFGLGDLKGTIREIIHDKPLVVVNTHAHFDHAYGNCQFDVCYCHENEVYRMQQKNNGRIWDYLFDEAGNPKWTDFDRNDLVKYKPYEIIGIKNGHLFDLGEGYEVEAVLLPGHTPGQCAYYDHTNKTIFIGDTTGIATAFEDEAFKEYCTVEAMKEALVKLQPRFNEIEGVFPGHGMLDQSSVVLQYLLNTCEAVLANPLNYDEKKVVYRHGLEKVFYLKYIYQGSGLRYTQENVYKNEDKL